MSVAPRTVPAMNPWHRLRDLVHVTLEWHDGGDMGVTTFETNTISLRRGMTREERRCTAMHEVLHVERGPVLETLEAREERRVRRETARILLPDVRALGEALAWSHTHEEAAAELDVDEGVLADRLRTLHPVELHYLRRRLDEAG